MALNPARTQRLVQVAAAAAAAPFGGRQAVYAAACRELGISLATLHRHLGQVTVKSERKQRSDAGAVVLERQEAIAISALLMESHRKTGKRLLPISEAVAMLRANGEVRADRTCAATGEVTPLSDSAIARALRHYGLHPDQLGRASPAGIMGDRPRFQGLKIRGLSPVSSVVCPLFPLFLCCFSVSLRTWATRGELVGLTVGVSH